MKGRDLASKCGLVDSGVLPVPMSEELQSAWELREFNSLHSKAKPWRGKALAEGD